MSTGVGLKAKEWLNSVGKTEVGREFHRTKVDGKNETPLRTSLGLLMLTQISCDDTALLVGYYTPCVSRTS